MIRYILLALLISLFACGDSAGGDAGVGDSGAGGDVGGAGTIPAECSACANMVVGPLPTDQRVVSCVVDTANSSANATACKCLSQNGTKQDFFAYETGGNKMCN